ncbi:lysine--tRNA ligase [Patescibacteria group bacterium]
MATLKELRNERIQKLEKLRKLGIDPFPAQAQKDFDNKEVVENFEKFENKEIVLAGRIITLRQHGAIIFADLHDQSGKIQLYIKEDSYISKDLTFENLKLLDAGDFIQATGKVTKTERGEISLLTTEIKLLAKSLRPLPDKRGGLKDSELIHRRRYVDLATNPERRALFERKAKFWEVNREFLKKQGFMEVETPILELIPGGADATPFTTHMNALDQDFYLRISPELYLKRLVGGGYEKVFTIGPNFRNEGLSHEHLPEFYNVEWYWAYADYRDNMEMIKEMFRYIANEVYGKTKFESKGHTFDLADEWEEIDYVETIKEKFEVDIFETSDKEILEILKKNKVSLPGTVNRNRLIDNLWKLIRKEVSGPAFLLNEPKFMSPLAKSKLDNPEITERFHIIIAGSENGNGYSELNDPFDQFERFKEQQSARDAGDKEAQMMDVDYVEMLEYGMPPNSGYAHGERLFWTLEGITAREGTLFPHMKPKLDNTTKEIYSL